MPALRRAAEGRKPAASTHGIATQVEIEKCLKQFKKMQIIFLPGTLSAWKSAGNRQSVPVPRSGSSDVPGAIAGMGCLCMSSALVGCTVKEFKVSCPYGSS
jgi:hypothetical protein